MRAEPFRSASRVGMTKIGIAIGCAFLIPRLLPAQAVPIAIVPADGVKLTGAIEIPDGKAAIESDGSITAGDRSVMVTLPHRGSLRVCQSTKVNLLTDSSVSASLTPETSGLMMALDRGALEANFSTRKNSDVILTPGFRIVISGPGIAAVQVRLGEKGDLCVDNKGEKAPYVTVSSIFEGGVYRVNASQRVSFQNGSLTEVVDNEKESCGCPPEAAPAQIAKANDFPIAQSEGLAPLPAPPANALQKGTVQAQATATLGYDGAKPPDARATAKVESPPNVTPPPLTPKPTPKPGFFRGVGRFFRKLFGG
jgi:hypothetical protein